LRKELYGYATDHFRVRVRKGPPGASYLSSSWFYEWPSWRCRSGKRQAGTPTLKRGRKKAHFRNDEKALGGEKESC
jgi:hypothetical protein